MKNKHAILAEKLGLKIHHFFPIFIPKLQKPAKIFSFAWRKIGCKGENFSFFSTILIKKICQSSRYENYEEYFNPLIYFYLQTIFLIKFIHFYCNILGEINVLEIVLKYFYKNDFYIKEKCTFVHWKN